VPDGRLVLNRKEALLTTLYEKRGRRYHPVQDTAAIDGLTNGTWIIRVEDGMRSYYRLANTGPTLEQIAAQATLTEAICEIVQAECRNQPGRNCRETLTPREQKAYAAFMDIAGPDATCWFTREGTWTVARRISGTIAELAKEEGE
jgi:hypothetical protein